MIQYDVDIFYLMLYAGVTFVAATACCYILFRRGNAFAPDIISSIRLRRWVAAFFAVMVLSHVWWFQLEFFRQYPDSLAYLAIAVGLDGATLIITVVGIPTLHAARPQAFAPASHPVAIAFTCRTGSMYHPARRNLPNDIHHLFPMAGPCQSALLRVSC